MSLPYPWSKWLLLLTGLVLCTGPTPLPMMQGITRYVDMNNPSCANTGAGTVAVPYCSVAHASTVANAGDLVLITAGVYPQGMTFTRNGTSSAPITYRAVGGMVAFAAQLVDESLTATATPNVYTMPMAVNPGAIIQRRYPPIVVTEPSTPPRSFTMLQADGPLRLNAAPDVATLNKVDGMYTWSAGVLTIHPFENVSPSTAATDFLMGAGVSNFNVTANWNVFDGITVWYTSNLTGTNNKYLNMRWEAVGLILSGTNSTMENIVINHVLFRRIDGNWEWDNSATGTAAGMNGSGHLLKNFELYHNWNSSISGEGSFNITVDRVRTHGSPNHCDILGNGNHTIRNVVWYNCQDYQWMHSINGVTIEHATMPGSGIGLNAAEGNLGTLTIRNSIFAGTIHFVRCDGSLCPTLPNEGCTWEAGSLMENNLISTNAQIERCDTQTFYPIDEYVARCGTGEFTGCMTIRNNIKVAPAAWNTAINGGMYANTMGDTWTPFLVPGSPAIDKGIKSGTVLDILGVTRPFGPAYDIGAYEYTGTTPTRPATDVVVAAPAQVTTTITAPTSGTTFNAGSATTLTTLAGTAKSGRTVTACTWTNSLGGAGAATGTTSWSVPSIALTIGSNVITVSCVNDGGTAGADVLTVTRASELLAQWRRWAVRAPVH